MTSLTADNAAEPPVSKAPPSAGRARLWYDRDVAFLWNFLLLGILLYIGIDRVWFRFLGSSPQPDNLISSWQWLALATTAFVEVMSFVLSILLTARLVRLPGGGHLRLGAVVVFGMIAPSLIYAAIHFFLSRQGLGMDIYHVVGSLFTIASGLAFSFTIGVPLRKRAVYLLAVLPSVLVLAGQMASYSMDGSLPGLLFAAAKETYLFAPIAWIMLLRPPVSVPAAAGSLLFSAAVMLVHRINPDVPGILTAILGIPSPVGWAARLSVGLSLWALSYLVTAYLLTGRRWGWFTSSVLLMWSFVAYGPYHSRDVWPQAIIVWAFLYVLPFMPEQHETGLKCSNAIPFLKERFPWFPASGAVECASGEVESISLNVGEPEGEPDWEFVTLARVSILPYLISAAPRFTVHASQTGREVVIWDNGFFSDDLLTPLTPQQLDLLGNCSISLWWGSGLAATIYAPTDLNTLEETLLTLQKLASKAGIQMPEDDGSSTEEPENAEED